MSWQNVHYDYRGAEVLVTGGTSGIGAGIAAAYREAGAAVTITGTRAGASDYAADLSGFRYLQLNLTDKAQIAAVAAALPRLDILVNNAGANFMLQNEYDPEVFEKGLQVNLTSAYRISQACRTKLATSKLQGGASIIGIASLTSFFGLEVVPAIEIDRGCRLRKALRETVQRRRIENEAGEPHAVIRQERFGLRQGDAVLLHVKDQVAAFVGGKKISGIGERLQ